MKYLALLSAAGVLFCATAAQNISVTVDGNPVRFSDVGPRMISGRVMVPLRGVLEAMGAFVDYNSATGTVMAQKGNIDLQLKIGDRTATVNGRTVALDVPAMTMSGRTMVPLRFMGESLGADVRWNEATQTVSITTAGNTNVSNTGGGNVGSGGAQINSFVHNGSGWLRAGSSLTVTMEGTPGGQASFRIPGIIESIPMRETSPGRYVASWTAPEGSEINLSGASVLGQLKVNGQERLIQAGSAISVDTQPPTITAIIPENNARIVNGQVSVSAVFDDANGSGVDPNSIRMNINGQDVTNEATRTSSFVNMRTSRLLTTRPNVVLVTAKDKAGNSVSKTWTFMATDASSAVRKLTHDAGGRVEAGDVITVRLEGQAGAQASFSVGRNKDLPMREESPGVYVGTYTVRKGEDLSNAPVVATLTISPSESYSIESEKRINAIASALDPPVIMSPIEGSTVSGDFAVTGKSAANTKVRVKVEYATTVLGALQLTGVLGEQVVQTDANGNFATNAFRLDTLVQGSNTQYTITAVAVTEAGKTSPPTTLKLRKA